MTENQHWLDRWRENRIAFHEAAVNRHLQIYLPQFELAEGARIFLPLCGKAQDIAWLADRGYEVIGIEISEIALEAFFSESGLDYERDDCARFEVYRSGRITLLKGDFFDLRADDLEGCALVYDRAALIAMTREQRPRYYAHMLSVVPAAADMLLITLEYDQTEMIGPPYSVLEDEVRENYQDAFSIQLLERNDFIDERPRWRKVGLSALGEVVFRLDR